MAYSLPELPYAYDALEPHIDARTMEIHHSKHHQAYINNVNAALEGTDLADTPVEPIQLHFMRVAAPQGQLAADFPDGWTPQHGPLLEHVLRENRRYQRIRNQRLLDELELVRSPGGWQCNAELSRQTGGLSYAEMVELAEQADFRHALWQMAEAIVDLFVQVIQEQPLLQDFPADESPSWEELSRKWRSNEYIHPFLPR